MTQNIQNELKRQLRNSLPLRRGGCWSLLAGMMLVCLTGCATTSLFGSKKYKPNNLPKHLVAPVQENAQTIDLTQFNVGSYDSELIDKGDVIEVAVSSGLEGSPVRPVSVRIDEQGMADIPIIGEVPLAKMDYVDAEAAIRTVAMQREIYRNPHVTITMKQRRQNRVKVVGAVKKQGIYELPRSGSDLLAALVAAGGIAENAGINVEIINPDLAGGKEIPEPLVAENVDAAEGKTIPAGHTASLNAQTKYSINLAASSSQEVQKYKLNDGAVVSVEQLDHKPIYVGGLVKKPNSYEFPVGKDLTVLQAISLSGGISNPVADKIYVIRKLEGQKDPSVIQVSMSKAKLDGESNIRLAPGDIVTVEQTTATVIIEAIRVLPFGVSASLGTLI